MTVRVYRSSDASAPTLTGAVGSLTALLDAVLVNGYGAQPAAGWSIGFTTTNKRGYLQNLTGSNNTSGMYLYIDDTGPGAGGAREARACGFETMSAITPTGTGQFPTSAQSAIGVGTVVIRKSATADATVRNWTIIANGQTLYMFIESGDTAANPIATTTFVFGDFKSYKASDQYAVIIIGRVAENNGSSTVDTLQFLQLSNSTGISALNTSAMGHYVARSWTGLGGAVKVGKPCDASRVYASVSSFFTGGYVSETQTSMPAAINFVPGRNNTTFQWPGPNGPDNALELSPFYIGHNWAVRGYLYGLWFSMHDRPLGHNDTFTVTGGNLSGKSFVNQNIQAYINGVANGDNGQVVIETSNTWA